MLHLAYIDPGAGSFVLQTIVATGLGAAYMVRSHIKRFFGRFRKGPNPEKSDQE